jgi:hypothetical protein
VGLAYLIRENWRVLQAAYTLPALIFLVYWWIAPESGAALLLYLPHLLLSNPRFLLLHFLY